MSSSAAPIPFARSMLREHRHVCAFFNSPKEEYDTLLPFICDGINCGQRAFYVLPSQHKADHLRRLRDAGIDVEKAQSTHQLEVALPGTPISGPAASTRTPCSPSSRKRSRRVARSDLL